MTRAEMKSRIESARKLITASQMVIDDSTNALELFKAQLEKEKKERDYRITAVEEKIGEITTLLALQKEGQDSAQIIFDSLSAEIQKAEESGEKE